MNYKKIYDQIIEKRRKQPLNKTDCYCESHHIVPRCMNGTDEESNLVNLTAREHYIAHLLLAKIYDTFGLYQAVKYMHVGCSKRIFKFNSHLYQRMKEKQAKKMSLNNPSKNPKVRAKISSALKGRKLSPEVRKKISAGLYRAMTPEVCSRMSAAHKGKAKSTTHKANIRAAKLGSKNPNYHKHWFTDGTHNILCLKCPKGFTLGRVVSKRAT